MKKQYATLVPAIKDYKLDPSKDKDLNDFIQICHALHSDVNSEDQRLEDILNTLLMSIRRRDFKAVSSIMQSNFVAFVDQARDFKDLNQSEKIVEYTLQPLIEVLVNNPKKLREIYFAITEDIKTQADKNELFNVIINAIKNNKEVTEISITELEKDLDFKEIDNELANLRRYAGILSNKAYHAKPDSNEYMINNLKADRLTQLSNNAEADIRGLKSGLERIAAPFNSDEKSDAPSLNENEKAPLIAKSSEATFWKLTTLATLQSNLMKKDTLDELKYQQIDTWLRGILSALLAITVVGPFIKKYLVEKNSPVSQFTFGLFSTKSEDVHNNASQTIRKSHGKTTVKVIRSALEGGVTE